LIAVVNQGRALANLPSLDGPTQTLPAIYALPQSDFHDITSGSNGDGQSAGPGYDLVTGIGTPIANLLVPNLAGVGSVSGNVFQDNNSDGINDGSDVNLAGVTVFIDANNNGTLVGPTNTTANGTGLPLGIPQRNAAGVNSPLTISGTTAPIINVSLTLNITIPNDSGIVATLIGPDGTTVTLFSRIGDFGANFTSTTLSGNATISIASETAPFTGTFAPSVGSLTAFNGKLGSAVNGTWTLNVADIASGATGTFDSWSLTVTTADTTATTDSNGNYIFNSVALGTYNIRQVVPAGEVQTGPGPGVLPAAANVVAVNNRVITGQNFADFPDVFSTTAISANEYVTLDPTGTILEIFNSASPGPTPNYQVPLADIPSLSFNMLGAGDSLYVDYTNGNPIPAGNLTFTGASGNYDNLTIIGQSPSQNLSLTDTQIGPATGSQILFSEVSTLSVLNCTANYTGNFNGFQTLFVGSTATLNWS
jgi:subtilisin-like proprotein convertase family protein